MAISASSFRVSNDPKILVGQAVRLRALSADPQRAWRWVGWFSLALTVAALSDWALAWVPLRFGVLEWEFGTIVATFSGLPLVAIGFGGLLASAVARADRAQIICVSAAVLLLALAMIGALVIFLLDVPVALQSSQGVAHLGIMKAIAKTLIMGIVFIAVFAAIGIAGLRYSFAEERSRH
jgi:hypothetical protein